MNKCKLGTILACCGVFILCNVANALVVLDPGQLIPVPKEISNGISKLGEIKSALTSLKDNLSAIGDKVDSISEFNKDASLKNPENNCKKVSATNDSVIDNIKGIAVAQSGIADILKIAQLTKKDLADGIVIQTEELINVASAENNEEIKANIAANFENVKELGSQLTEDVNEAFDTALNTVNQNAQKSHEALANLRKMAMFEEKLNADERDAWRSNELNNREQAISDEGINMIEVAHEQYNKEYKEKFSDELNNYQKVVLAYADGNADKEDVIKAGEQFKIAVANISVTLNEEKRANYRENATELQNEIESVTQNMIQRIKA